MKYRNIGKKGVHTGTGEVCAPGDVFETAVNLDGHPFLKKVVSRKKKEKAEKK